MEYLFYALIVSVVVVLVHENAPSIARAVVRFTCDRLDLPADAPLRGQWMADLAAVEQRSWMLVFAFGILAKFALARYAIPARSKRIRARQQGITNDPFVLNFSSLAVTAPTTHVHSDFLKLSRDEISQHIQDLKRDMDRLGDPELGARLASSLLSEWERHASSRPVSDQSSRGEEWL